MRFAQTRFSFHRGFQRTVKFTQLARHLAKRFANNPSSLGIGIQRQRGELTMFNTLTGGDQLIQRANDPPRIRRRVKDQSKYADTARQRYGVPTTSMTLRSRVRCNARTKRSNLIGHTVDIGPSKCRRPVGGYSSPAS